MIYIYFKLEGNLMNASPLILKTEDKKMIFAVFDPNDPVYVFDIGYHRTPPLHTFGPAIRPYYLLHLIEKGKGHIERGGVITHLSEGDAFLIRPEETTTYVSDREEPWVYSWISFHGSFASTLMQRTTDQLCMKYQKSGLVALKNALTGNVNDNLGCLNTLFEVLNAIKSAPTPKPTEPDPIATALHYFETNYFQNIDVGTFASQIGFSRAYFSTLFAKQTGESPYGYLTKIRIEKAKEYLKNDAYSVEEIAYSVGFCSLQRFSEMFKKYTGLSPSHYRKILT